MAYLVGIADEFDPSVVQLDDEPSLMQLDLDPAPAEQDERECRHYGAAQNEDARRLKFLVERHVGKAEIPFGRQNGGRMNLHLEEEKQKKT